MSVNNKAFSTAKLHCTDQALALHFLDDPADVRPACPPPLLEKVLVLEGVLALGCTDPRCLSGTDPFRDGVFELEMEIRLTLGSTGQASLLAITAGMGGTWVPVPVLDSSYDAVCEERRCTHDHGHGDSAGCGRLRHELRTRRIAAQLPEETRFYVYRVTETRPEARPEARPVLAALRDKLIAIPIVPGLPGNQPR